MVIEPTTHELRCAYLETSLWVEGISFEKAMASRPIRMALRCKVQAWKRQAANNGMPAPSQPALI